jgi:hypothetical protein
LVLCQQGSGVVELTEAQVSNHHVKQVVAGCCGLPMQHRPGVLRELCELFAAMDCELR